MPAVRPYRPLTFQAATGSNEHVSSSPNAPAMKFIMCAVGGRCQKMRQAVPEPYA
jgi:hypothetical protein